ncbi:hypothetical protein F153LOC_13565 [Lelliottia sp. F153]|nr:hypothetical protein F153LOC_13565 [Lelliottia sp. F153]
MKSGTESFNCPDSEILCDLNHVNVGGGAKIEVIFVTNVVCKKNTQGKNPPGLTLLCDHNHILCWRVCWMFVIIFTINLKAEFSRCDRRPLLFCQFSQAVIQSLIFLNMLSSLRVMEKKRNED